MKDEVYGVFSGYFSNWNIHGYFNTLEEAEKYCALRNKNLEYYYDNYYVVKIPKIEADVSNIKLKYYHEIIFDFDTGMRNEPNRYSYYIGEKNKPLTIQYNVFANKKGWILFKLTCETRQKAEKIAQDKYAEFLTYYNETGSYHKAAKLIGAEKI